MWSEGCPSDGVTRLPVGVVRRRMGGVGERPCVWLLVSREREREQVKNGMG